MSVKMFNFLRPSEKMVPSHTRSHTIPHSPSNPQQSISSYPNPIQDVDDTRYHGYQAPTNQNAPESTGSEAKTDRAQSRLKEAHTSSASLPIYGTGAYDMSSKSTSSFSTFHRTATHRETTVSNPARGAATYELGQNISPRPSPTRRLSRWFDGQSEPVRISLLPTISKEKVEQIVPLSDNACNASGTPLINSSKASPFSQAKAAITSSLSLNVTDGSSSAPPSLTDAELKAVLAENATLSEEKKASDMRIELLRSQLDDLATKLANQSQVNNELAAQLGKERAARSETAAGARTVRMVENEPAFLPTTQRSSRLSQFIQNGEVCSDDSEDESVADSVFSQPNRRPYSQSSSSFSPFSSTTSLPQGPYQAQLQQITPLHQAPRLQVPSQGKKLPQMGTIAGGDPGLEAALREENEGMRERIAELEETLEGCLGLVSAMG